LVALLLQYRHLSLSLLADFLELLGTGFLNFSVVPYQGQLLLKLSYLVKEMQGGLALVLIGTAHTSSEEVMCITEGRAILTH
jgi:hypothetical protein